MKKRRSLIIALLLIAALCLGIGYAAVTDVFDITGVVELDGAAADQTFDGEVYFSDISGNKDKAAGSALLGDKSDNASFMVSGLSALEEEVSVTYTIRNDHGESVWITEIEASNAKNDNLEITYDFPNGTEIAPDGGEITVVVTAKVIKLTDATVSLNYGLHFHATNENPNP